MFFFSDKPGKPNNFQVIQVLKDSVVLSWQPPTNSGGSDITGYTVEKRDAKRNTWAPVANVDGQTTTYAVQKLIEGNEYFFRVSAKNDIGTGEPAEIDRATVAKSPYGEQIILTMLLLREKHDYISSCLTCTKLMIKDYSLDSSVTLNYFCNTGSC